MTLSTKKEIALPDLLEYASSTLFHGAKEADEKHICELATPQTFLRGDDFNVCSCVRDKVKIYDFRATIVPLTDTEIIL